MVYKDHLFLVFIKEHLKNTPIEILNEAAIIILTEQTIKTYVYHMNERVADRWLPLPPKNDYLMNITVFLIFLI